MSAELANWLLEQIAHDEALAQRAPHREGRRWRYEPGGSQPDGSLGTVWDGTGTSAVSIGGRWVGHHVANWDPARVLAECAAKRATVATYQRWLGDAEAWRERARYGGNLTNLSSAHQCDDYASVLERAAIKPMARVYADREGFKGQWRD